MAGIFAPPETIRWGTRAGSTARVSQVRLWIVLGGSRQRTSDRRCRCVGSDPGAVTSSPSRRPRRGWPMGASVTAGKIRATSVGSISPCPGRNAFAVPAATACRAASSVVAPAAMAARNPARAESPLPTGYAPRSGDGPTRHAIPASSRTIVPSMPRDTSVIRPQVLQGDCGSDRFCLAARAEPGGACGLVGVALASQAPATTARARTSPSASTAVRAPASAASATIRA